MLDRQDIDALLVGALYGELSSTDQERLSAHLEANPADRNALDDLKSAQQVIRSKVASSRIFELQLDPPQAISAQLLQEAARRAPKLQPRDAADAVKGGWFARFLHSFVAHPAMAAAATLVLVVGVAGSLYLRTGDKGIAEPTVGQAALPAQPAAATASNEPGIAASNQAASQEGKGAATGGYQRERGEDADRVAVALSEDKPHGQAEAIGRADRAATGAVEKAVPPRRMATPAAKAAVVRSQSSDLEPKELDEGQVAMQDKAKNGTNGRPQAPSAAPFADDSSTTMAVPRAAGPGGGAARPAATATVAASPPPPAPVQAPAPTAKAPDANYAWAKDQHARLAALVKAGNCQEAAPLAVAIKSRDPEYYSSFVATDRVLKPCMQYLTEAADRETEKRPAKSHVTTETR